MYIALGVSLLSAAALLLAWAYAAHRRPVPAGWTQREFLSSSICIVITALLPIGVGYLIAALVDPIAALWSLGPVSVALILVSPVLCWLAIPRLLASANVATAAPTVGPPPRSPRPASSPTRPSRQKRASSRAA